MLKLKLQYFGHLMRRADLFEKTLMLGERLRAGGEGATEDEMVGWCHWLNGHEFKQAPGVGDGQGVLACCSPWGHKESDMTERLNWTELKWGYSYQDCSSSFSPDPAHILLLLWSWSGWVLCSFSWLPRPFLCTGNLPCIVIPESDLTAPRPQQPGERSGGANQGGL